MHRTQRATTILRLLKKHYPDSKTALRYRTPMQLLVAVVLSAQCTDARVNLVTKDLFRTYTTAADFARADLRTLQRAIYSTGFYRNKAKHIVAAAQKIERDFHGRVPDTMTQLLTLPGVARKTANVVLSAAFGKQEGIAVDTHVRRISRRWKLTSNTDPARIERALLPLIPQKDWGFFSWATILHGRALCTARNPLCAACPLQKACPSAFRA